MKGMDGKRPKIRFPEFTDDWEKRKLGDVIDKLTGGASIAPDDYVEDGYRTIPKGAVNDTGVADMSGCKNVSESFFMRNISSKTSTGELVTSLRDLVPTAPNMGRIVRICGEYEDFLMPQGVYSIILNENMDEDFLIAYSNSPEYRKIIMTEKNGSTQVHIRNGEFLDIDIPIPSFEEQRKIGKFFSDFDNRIVIYQKKLEHLQELKKSLLQKMFPKKDEKVPEIRFPVFTGDWEQRKFSEIAQRQSETMVSDDDNPCIEYDDVIADQGILNKDVYSKGVYKNGIRFTSEDVLYGKLRPYLHNWLNPNFSGVAVGDWWVLRPINANKNFLFILIQTSQYDDAANQSSGTKMPRADWKFISNMEFQIPVEIEEQERIAGVFYSLDNLITFHQCKLVHIKELKQYMLRNMFV